MAPSPTGAPSRPTRRAIRRWWQRLYNKGVSITARPQTDNVPWFVSLLISWLPFVALIGVWIFLSRQMQGAGGKALGFGKSRAKLLTEAHGRVTFEDVAGVDEAKLDLQEIVEFLRDPAKFQRLGGRIPRGVLLVGPPGTGKTLLARAIAGEANVPFFTISGSDFVEMFVGVGASRVRDMFEQAKKNAPCIIFIDEIDAVGRHRGAGLGGGNDEREQTLNQLLVEMDGFEANEGIILIAATNRPDVLDPALLRPGRFDRQVVVPNPDVVGREQILKVHVRKVPLAPDVVLKTIARGTPGFSGADLMNLVNEAALMAARRNKRMVTQVEFEDAKDKVMMGAERKSLVMTEEEKLLTAYHEGGHAIVALNVKATDPVHKATIIPRGRALGMVMQLPERDKLSMSLEQMTSRLAIMMGGRVAEELVFGRERVTSGAASDIEQATKLARMMVTRWGLSEALGTVAYGENQEEVFLGYSVSRQQSISEATVQKIDAEIRRLVEAGYNEAQEILTDQARRSRNAGQGPARIRNADRRRDQGFAVGQAAEPRVGHRADHAANLDRADRRRRPQPAAPRARPAGAAAARLSHLSGASMRTAFIAGVALALATSPLSAQTGAAPQPPPGNSTQSVVKPAASTPELRSAAELALSADPVFDDGTYQRIKEALLSYSAIEVRGGWPALPADAKLAPGASGPEVALLRQHLVISDDMPEAKWAGDAYDADVVEAVKRFQLRHGLDATGTVGAQTLKALNVPVGDRIKQLEASLERLIGMDFIFAERYVVVNIPAAFVEAVANGKVERRYRVIVGKIDKPSPTLSVYITAIDLNPTWTVPLSITKNEIYARMRRDPTYLARMHMRLIGAQDQDIDPATVDWSGDRSPNFTVRQDAGNWNALGNLKIDMPNPYSVYMHDTDTRKLFADDYRFDSHGCTRVDNVRDLAAWILLDGPPGWDRAAIDAGIATGQTKIINLPRKIPVAWVYLTGWVRRDGTVEFRDDVYKHDEALDPNGLAEAAAGGFVAPVPTENLKRVSIDSQ